MCLSLAVVIVTDTPDATQFLEGHAPGVSEPGTSPRPDLGEGTRPSQSSTGTAEPDSGIKEGPLSAWGQQLQQ